MLDTDLVTFVPSSQSGPIPVHVPLREIHITTAQSVSVLNGGNLADCSKTAPHVEGLKLKKRQYSKSPDSHVTEAHPAKVPKHVRSPDSHVTQAHPAKEPLYGIVTENERKQTVPIGSLTPEGRQGVAAGSLTPEGRQAVAAGSLAPEGRQGVAAGSSAPEGRQGVAAGSLTPEGRQGVATGSLTPEGRQGVAAGSSAPEGRQGVAAGSSAPEGRQGVATGSSAPEGRQGVAAGSSAPEGRQGVAAGSLTPEGRQGVATGSSAPEGRQGVAAGSLTPEGRQGVVLERSAPVDNELDVLLRLYQRHPLGEEPQSVESECQPVGGFNRSPPASPPKTNSTGGHGKEEEEEKRGDSFLATSYLDGTLPFKHNEGESMAVNSKEDGVCKDGLQSCSSAARTVGVSLSDEGDGEGATSSTAARTPRKCSTSTKKARKFVFSSGSKGAPSRRTAKKCLMLEYTDNEPPPPPPPQQEGVDEGDGSEGLRRGKSTTTLFSFLEDYLARVLHN